MHREYRSNIHNVVSSNPAHGEVNSKQHYAIKFDDDLRQFGGFLRILHSAFFNKKNPGRHDITEIMLKMALNTINPPYSIYLLSNGSSFHQHTANSHVQCNA